MRGDAGIKISKVSSNIVNIKIPSIEVDYYPIWRADGESEPELFHRATKYATELLRRHECGEPYAIGYREQEDGKIHMVIRMTKDSGRIILQRILGIDEDFKPI